MTIVLATMTQKVDHRPKFKTFQRSMTKKRQAVVSLLGEIALMTLGEGDFDTVISILYISNLCICLYVIDLI